MYQTIVIGGGPSGAMAAVAASEKNESVLLIEKKNILRLAMKKSMTIDFFIAIFYSYREK